MRTSAAISFAASLAAILAFASVHLDHLVAGTKMPVPVGIWLFGIAILACVCGATLLVLQCLIALRREVKDITVAGRGADEYLAIRHRIQHR